MKIGVLIRVFCTFERGDHHGDVTNSDCVALMRSIATLMYLTHLFAAGKLTWLHEVCQPYSAAKKKEFGVYEVTAIARQTKLLPPLDSW